jgi:hypothetical protein
MSNQPTHIVYHVREGNDFNNKGYWTRVGAAWAHQDGKGFNVQLTLSPLDGRLVLRTADAKPQPEQQEQGA